MHINIFIFFLFMHINTHHVFTKIQTTANFYKMPTNLYEQHDHGSIRTGRADIYFLGRRYIAAIALKSWL